MTDRVPSASVREAACSTSGSTTSRCSSSRDGRLLLRGANGAGKSKTMEMLLPFVLDGDKARMTASGRHHTSLLWLMLDGYDGQNRTGYLWVEFARPRRRRHRDAHCGVGMRASRVRADGDVVVLHVAAPGRRRADARGRRGPARRQRLRAEVEARAGTSSTRRRALQAARRPAAVRPRADAVRRAAAAALLAAPAAGRRGHRARRGSPSSSSRRSRSSTTTPCAPRATPSTSSRRSASRSTARSEPPQRIGDFLQVYALVRLRCR